MSGTKSVTDLKAIAKSGAGLILNALHYSTTDLKAIATAAKGNGAKVVIRNPDAKSTTDLKAIAEANSGFVVFDFSN